MRLSPSWIPELWPSGLSDHWCDYDQESLRPILLKHLFHQKETTPLSAVQHWAFDQEQIRLISARYYLHCPWFDTNFRIILSRFTEPLAGVSHPILVNKDPAHKPPLDGNLSAQAVCLCKLHNHQGRWTDVCCHGSASSQWSANAQL